MTTPDAMTPDELQAIEERIIWIKSNLPTLPTWTAQDLREFYIRDVEALIGFAEVAIAAIRAERAENERLRMAISTTSD